MRAVVQRVTQSSVTVEGHCISAIDKGLMVLLGVDTEDTPDDASWMADKISGLRIFEDGEQKMNLSIIDTDGSILLISQFTLCGDARKGKRPSFIHAARPEQADELYLSCVKLLRERGITVETGQFGADMQVSLINDGPVTILLDSKKLF